MKRVCALILFAVFGLSAISRAAETKAVVWETTKNVSPETIEELKGLQSRVKDVQKKANECTVGLLVGQGAGSGVIVSEDGLVLTAAHVIVKPRAPIVFVLADGTTVKGESLGMNSSADSGMARITDKPPKDAKWKGAKEGKWPVMEMGKSADLVVGQWVVSLGHPGGPKQDRPPPVRLGRFRAANRFLSTDCTLVGGDSGGPLFDLDGKVIGIHSQIGFTLEMNMHVPMDKFKNEWDRLVRGDNIGKKPEVDLGVKLDTTFKKDGAKIEEVIKDGSAAKAGIEDGDVITKFNGFAVKSAPDLLDILTGYSDGAKVKVTVERDDETKVIEIKLVKKGSSTTTTPGTNPFLKPKKEEPKKK